MGWTRSWWLKESAEIFLHVLKNVESNADLKGLHVVSLVIEHSPVNKAPKMWRRTYGVHGQINPYMSSPCRTETTLSEKGRLFLNQKRKLHRRKRYPRRN